MLDLVLFVSGASLILVTRTSFVVAAYVVLAALTTAFVAPSAAHAFRLAVALRATRAARAN